jgi:hypothetical protein
MERVMAGSIVPWDRVPFYRRPEEGVDPTFDSGLPEKIDEVFRLGEQALSSLREDTVQKWIAAGAAWQTMQQLAIYRSHSNRPKGRRYAAAYALLEHPWPELKRVDPKSRMHAIWLFTEQDIVLAWLASLPTSQRDKWCHPTVIRRHFLQRHPNLPPKKTTAHKRRPSKRNHKGWNTAPLGERTIEDLRAMVKELGDQLVDRDQEIAELHEVIEGQDQRIAELEHDLEWEQAEKRQLNSILARGAGVLR